MLQSQAIFCLINSFDIERKNASTTILFTFAACWFIGLQVFNHVNLCAKTGTLNPLVHKFISVELIILVVFIIENCSKLFKWNNIQTNGNGLCIYLPTIGINIFVLISTLQQYFQATYYCENVYG